MLDISTPDPVYACLNKSYMSKLLMQCPLNDTILHGVLKNNNFRFTPCTTLSIIERIRG